MNKQISYIYLIVTSVCLLTLTSGLKAQLVINEYSCANISDVTDNYGEYEDWIELYNAGASAIDISAYYLSDRLSNPLKWQFPAGTSINAGAYLLVFASARNESGGGNYHTNFKLTQTKNEHIIISDPSGATVDVTQIIPTQRNHSRGREIDGGNTWSLFMNSSANASNSNPYAEYATTPIFNIEAGYSATSIGLEISSPDPDVIIRYTDNGSEPVASSTEVTGPINISVTTVIRARSFPISSTIPASFIETNTYFIGDQHTIDVVSICGDDLAALLNGSYSSPDGAFELFDKNMTLLAETTGEYNKHGNDSWAYSQRGIDFISRDEYGYNHAVNHQIFDSRDRESFQRLILKAAANDNYPFEDGAHIRDSYVHMLSHHGGLNLDVRTHESCILYMNGNYWGVYEIREKADDHDFTEYYFDQSEDDLQYLKTWGGTWSEYGGAQSQTDWDDLKNYILTNDMTVQANFDYVTSQYDWTSLVDYVVLNSYVVCSDWLNWNTAWWRGFNTNGDAQTWRYVLWDMDATFGHYINYTGIPNTNPNADPCNPEGLNDPGNQGHIPILNALSLNETFRQYYVSRFIDLSNTVFNCDYMQNMLDSLIEIIEPEMGAQCAKWGGTYAIWQTEVEELKQFIDQRCIDLSDGLIDCYDLTGPFDVMFMVEPEGIGEIKINSIYPNAYPFTGTYYGDIDILLKAETEVSGYVFDHWELLHHGTFPTITDQEASLSLLSSDTIIAVFANPVPIVDLGLDTAICVGNTITLNAGNPDASYSWSNGFTTQSIEVSTPGTYTVSVTNQGFTTIDEIEVEVNSPPTVELGSVQQICPGQQVYLSGETTNALEYNWSTADSISEIIVSDAGMYFLSVTNLCGEAVDSVYISVGYSPYVELGENLIIEPGTSVVLDATSIEASYLWHDNSTGPYFTASEPGQYWVIVTNSCGSAFDDISLTYETELIIPNSFTPNGDGLNDEFTIYAKGIADEDFLLQIFDRLGALVFETNDINDSWDGIINSDITASNVFIFVLDYKDLLGETFHKTGTVTVLLR